jgi:hypothetical protein
MCGSAEKDEEISIFEKKKTLRLLGFDDFCDFYSLSSLA